jgi:hypothetical protein
MAVLFQDGCQHYSTEAQMDTKWDSASDITSIPSTGGRWNTQYLNLGSSSQLTKTIGSHATYIVGYALYLVQFPSSNDILIRFREGTTVHMVIAQDTSGGLVALRAGSTEVGRVATGMEHDVWMYLEAKVVVADGTSGSVEIHINGAQVANITGVDTRNGGTGVIDNFQIHGPSGGCRVQDVYAADGSGSAPYNDILGDCRVDELYPDGDGNYTEFGTTTGTPHSGEVDETSPDDDTTAITATAVNQRDTFTMANLAAITSQTIFNVQLVSWAKWITGATNFRMKYRRVADHDGASQALASAYGYFMEQFNTDPQAGAAWTETNINAMESGVEEL